MRFVIFEDGRGSRRRYRLDDTAYKALEQHAMKHGARVSDAGGGVVPDKCPNCSFAKIATSRSMGQNYWTCSDCGTTGDL